MSSIPDDLLYILMPPDFDYMGGLFIPDFSRARLVARLAMAVVQWCDQGCPVSFDPGTRGLTAPGMVQYLKNMGVQNTVIVGGDYDHKATSILYNTLHQAGIDCPQPVLITRDSSALPQILLSIVTKLEMKGNPIPDFAYPCTEADESFFILEGEESFQGPGVIFRWKDRRLVRISEGAVYGIPTWTREIKFIYSRKRPQDRLPANISSDIEGIIGKEKDVIYVFVISRTDNVKEESFADWLDTCGRIIERTGVERFRLTCTGSPQLSGERRGGAAWIDRYGMTNPLIRGFLRELVAGYFPERLGYLQVVLGFSRLGIDPLEEMYAGNTLPDRNPELLKNILT